MEIVDKT